MAAEKTEWAEEALRRLGGWLRRHGFVGDTDSQLFAAAVEVAGDPSDPDLRFRPWASTTIGAACAFKLVWKGLPAYRDHRVRWLNAIRTFRGGLDEYRMARVARRQEFGQKNQSPLLATLAALLEQLEQFTSSLLAPSVPTARRRGRGGDKPRNDLLDELRGILYRHGFTAEEVGRLLDSGAGDKKKRTQAALRRRGIKRKPPSHNRSGSNVG